MNKSRIEWTDYTVNDVKGYCPMACSYCYARRMYDRYKWDKTIRQDLSAWAKGVNINSLRKPSRIFVGSTIERFHSAIKDEWNEATFSVVKAYPQHTFIFLTKCPQNLIKFREGNPEYHHYIPANKFSSNVWIGVSITSHLDAPKARDLLKEKMGRVNFLSIEPLLGKMDAWALANIIYLADWVIIGAQTQPLRLPKLERVEEIVKACDKAGIPVFLKNNLHSLIDKDATGQFAIGRELLTQEGKLRQEFPCTKSLVYR